MPKNLNSKTGNQKRSPKRLWLNAKYQGRYILWVMLTGLVLVAFQSAVFFAFTRENYAILVDLSPMSDEAKTQLYRELSNILWLLGAGSMVFLVLMGLLGLFFSHRTVGPLYNFKRVFEAIKNGKRSERIHLRPRDDFQEVARSFNEMMDSLDGK